MDTLYLVDGSNFLFRAYHALPPMSTKGGIPTGAVLGFANMMVRMLNDRHPGRMAVIFDAGGRSARTARYPEYKANRPPCPPDLVIQFDLARRLIAALGILALDARDVEADDLIATLARRAAREGLRVVIVSSDKDLMQLCDENTVLWDTMKEGGRGKFIGPVEVSEKYGVAPAQVPDFLALLGDPVDNVPGVPGIGEKTAASLLGQFGTVEGLLENIDAVSVRGAEKVKAALREHAQQLRLAKQLTTLDTNVPIRVSLPELAVQPMRTEELGALLQELEFKALLSRLAPQPVEAALPSGPRGAAQEAGDRSGLALVPPTVLLDETALREHARRLGERAGSGLGLSVLVAGIEGEKDHSARVAPLCGLALYAEGQDPVYLPLGHRYLGAPQQLRPAAVLDALGPILGDPGLPKMVFGAKDVHLALSGYGLPIAGIRSDPALCSYLLDASAAHDLRALAVRHLDIRGGALMTRQALCTAGKRSVPIESLDVAQVAPFAAAEAQAILLLGGRLREQLDPASLALLDEMELPLARVLAVMERHGVLLDVAVLRALSDEVAERLAALEAEIHKEAGYEVNIGSPRQLQELLFEKLGLPPVKKTKTGLSTDAEVLETLAALSPIVRRIHEHRGLAKLKNTYIDQLPSLVDPHTGRLHTSYNQVVAATGRLSSQEPNLQNVPIRTELGRSIRRAFIAAPGHVLVAADYSQIELRVLAHLSGDPLLLQSFREGQDVHERTAIEMFGEEGRKPELRRAAKMINYGIVYGITDYGLASRLSIDRSVAKTYIKEYFARYSGVHAFMNDLVDKARREGGARTLLGRFRPLPDISSRNFQARAYAERIARNTPIQGTAADILKRAMIDLQGQLEVVPEVAGTRLLLTVHDELVLEAPREKAEATRALVKATMASAYNLSVPLVVDVGSGANWADCN